MTSTNNQSYIKQAVTEVSAIQILTAPGNNRSISHFVHRYLRIAMIVIFAAIITACGDELTIHNPNARTFFVPNDDEPLSVLISLPDTWHPGSNIMMITLHDDDGGVVLSQGYIPMTAQSTTIEPGSIEGQKKPFDIPADTATGWHTLRAIGIRRLDDGTNEIITGESERFWISRIGTHENDSGLDVNLSTSTAPPPWRQGGLIDIYLINMDEIPGFESYGFNCGGYSTPHALLFKGGSHGRSHQHWILESTASAGVFAQYALPDDAPPGSDYFLWVENGPICNGTSDYFEIAAP